jgi:hypothetical protein
MAKGKNDKIERLENQILAYTLDLFWQFILLPNDPF